VKVLLIGYACIPHTGGETSNTWNWAWHLSRFHEVWVLACPGDRPIAESFLAECPNSHLKLLWLGVPRLLDRWSHGRGNVGLAVHYLQWLRLAYAKAIDLHEQIGFDIVHHTSFGTVNAAPVFWKLPFLSCGGRLEEPNGHPLDSVITFLLCRAPKSFVMYASPYCLFLVLCVELPSRAQ